MEEVWKPISGYEGLYEVSTLGRVKRVGGKVTHANRWGGISSYQIADRLRTLKANSANGYVYVMLSSGGTARNKRVHRLVAEAFIPNPDNKPYVNHIDGDKTNNSVDNLEWVTARENVLHSRDVLHTNYAKGCPITHRKNQKPIVRDDGVVYGSVKELLESGEATKTIYGHLKGRRKSYKGHVYKYVE